MPKFTDLFHNVFRIKTLPILGYWGVLGLILCLGNDQPNASEQLQVVKKRDEKIVFSGNQQKTSYSTDKAFRISDFKGLGYQVSAKNPTDKNAELLMGWCVYDRDFQPLSTAQFNALDANRGTVVFDVKFFGRRGKLLIMTDNVAYWKTIRGKKNVIVKKDVPPEFPDKPIKNVFIVLDVKELTSKVVEVSVWTNAKNKFIPSGTEVGLAATGINRMYTDRYVVPPHETKQYKTRLLTERGEKGGFPTDKWPIGAVYVQPVIWSQSPNTVIEDFHMQSGR